MSTPQHRLRRKRRPAPVSSGWTIRYAFAALVAVLVVAVAAGVLIRLLIGRGALALGIDGLLTDAAMLASLIPLYRRHNFSPRALGLRGAPPARSVGLVFAAVVAIAITNSLWLRGVLGLKQPDTLDISLRGSTAALVVAGAFIAVSAPIVEEIFFRGVLYRALRNRLSVPWAAAIAGIVFGLVHGISYPLDTLPPRMVFGVIACLLYERTGSLLPGMALHCLIDAGGFELAVSGHNRIVFPAFLGLGVLLLAYAAVRRWRTGPTGEAVRPTVGPPSGPSPA